MKFLHLTDLHVTADGLLYGLDPAERLRACIADIVANHADASLVLVTGDLTHDGREAAYRRLKDMLGALPLPVHLMIGNHDNRETFQRVFTDVPRDASGFVQFTVDTEAGKFICLDTNEGGVHHGVLNEKRLEWLSDGLDRAGDASVYLFMHHPPFPVGIPSMDAYSLRDSDRFAHVVADRGNIKHLFFGHVHRPISGFWKGIPFANLPGLNHQVALDFRVENAVPGSHEPPAYAVVFVEGDATIVHLHHFLDRTNTFNL